MKLSRLSRLSRLQSVNVKQTTPGNANPYFLEKTNPIDRNHPAFKQNIHKLPSYTCPQFTIRALPNGVMQVPASYVPINPLLATGVVRAGSDRKGKGWWSKIDVGIQKLESEPATSHIRGLKQWEQDKRDRCLMANSIADTRMAALADGGRRSLGLAFRTAKKTTSKSCVVRRRLRTKMTTAIRLVVGRGADTVSAPESDEPRPDGSHPPLTLITNPLPEHDKLILQDWTYLVVPELSLYRMPMPNIVQHVRKAFQRMMHSAHRLEETWAATQRNTHKPLRHPSPASPLSRPRTLAKPPNQNPAEPAQRPPIPLSPSYTIETSEPDTELVQTLTSLPEFPRPLTQSPRRPRTLRPSPNAETPVKRARPSSLPRMFSRPPLILPHSKPTNADEK